MLKKIFFPKTGKKLEKQRNPGGSPPENPKSEAEPGEEFQIPSLHRRAYPITEEVLRRREEEALCRRYGLSPSKTGTYL